MIASLDQTQNNNLIELQCISLLIQDYKLFKAARLIQRSFLIWRKRRQMEKRWEAAITIQRWWRGYWVRKNFMLYVEQKLQTAIFAHYNKAATKIQALFRGWWVRHTIEDWGARRRLQKCAAEDLLHCVAYKLHHMLRTYSIPGVYSLANSHCLSRVEKLLSSLRYRFYNAVVHKNMLFHQDKIKSQRQQFTNAAYYTKVPYPDIFCKDHCLQFMNKTRDLDKRMYQIIAAYDESMRDERKTHTKQTLSTKEIKRRKRINKILHRKERKKLDFCGDVIASMRRWDIWNDKKLTIEKDIFRSPEKLEHFLKDAIDILSALTNCHCTMPALL
ncbi:GH23059 [Drosophila grimshawi]|uniref:GH23059 n=1 Tax=Drosophila grimshawi TaxID=7222 RepID=B4JWK2_DROGR|nr:GH23059 [Drosophila grimshawi]